MKARQSVLVLDPVDYEESETIYCKSISEAVRIAEEQYTPYFIFDKKTGECLKGGNGLEKDPVFYFDDGVRMDRLLKEELENQWL